MTRVKATWPNGSAIIGTIKDIERGGKNIAFGPDDTLAIMYVVPEDNEDFPHGVLHIFDSATVEPIEPTEFATVIRARRHEDGTSHRWVRYAAGWLCEDSGIVVDSYSEFDPSSIVLVREGI